MTGYDIPLSLGVAPHPLGTGSPRKFPSRGCVVIPESLKIEEETLPDYVPGRYYPVRIGEVLASRYQVVGKLGYGMTSTVWLARDLTYDTYSAGVNYC